MARRKRPAGAKQINAWLSPEAHDTLERWQVHRGYPDKTATLEAILAAVRRKLEGGAPAEGSSPRETPKKDAPLTSYPRAGWCSACGERQYRAPGGEVCRNGHGGCAPAPPKPSKRHRWIGGEWLDPDDPDERAIIDGADTARRSDEVTVDDVLGEQEEDDLADASYYEEDED